MVMIQPKGEVGIKTPWLDLFFSGSVRLNQVGAKQIRGRKIKWSENSAYTPKVDGEGVEIGCSCL